MEFHFVTAQTQSVSKNKRQRAKDKEAQSALQNQADTAINAVAAAGAVNEDEAKRRNEAFKEFVVKSPLYSVCNVH